MMTSHGFSCERRHATPPVHPPLGRARIRRAYLACRHPIEKARWHAIWLLARAGCPRAPAQVAQLVGLSDVAARALLRLWNLLGPKGLADRREGNGRTARLGARRRAALARAVARRPPAGGLWAGRKLARYALDRWGARVRPKAGWLRRPWLTPQAPRPRHPRTATDAAPRRWDNTEALTAFAQRAGPSGGELLRS